MGAVSTLKGWDFRSMRKAAWLVDEDMVVVVRWMLVADEYCLELGEGLCLKYSSSILACLSMPFLV